MIYKFRQGNDRCNHEVMTHKLRQIAILIKLCKLMNVQPSNMLHTIINNQWVKITEGYKDTDNDHFNSLIQVTALFQNASYYNDETNLKSGIRDCRNFFAKNTKIIKLIKVAENINILKGEYNSFLTRLKLVNFFFK